MEISEYFRLAIQLYMKKMGWGSQKKIAAAIGIQQSYLSEFLNGKRAISENARVRLSQYVNFNYEEMIALGRKLSNQSPDLLNEQRNTLAGKFKPDLLKSIREKNNFTIKDFARILYISETEYIFKEEGLLPFTFMELSILFENISKIQAELSSSFNTSGTSSIETIRKQIDSLPFEEKKDLKRKILEESCELKKKFSKAYSELGQIKKKS